MHNYIFTRIVMFLLPENKPFIPTEAPGETAMLNRHVSIVGQNVQTKHWL